MTARQRAPHKGTGPDLALQVLHGVAGQSTGEDWYTACWVAHEYQPAQWEGFVQSLISAGLVFQRRGQYHVTDEGYVFLGAEEEIVPREEPLLVPARTASPMRPLSAQYRPDLRTMRAGALDYGKIPSLHGDARVAFRTSLKAAGGDAAA